MRWEQRSVHCRIVVERERVIEQACPRCFRFYEKHGVHLAVFQGCARTWRPAARTCAARALHWVSVSLAQALGLRLYIPYPPESGQRPLAHWRALQLHIALHKTVFELRQCVAPPSMSALGAVEEK